MLKAGSASRSASWVYVGREFIGQVLALGAQAIIGTAETDCVHRGTSGSARLCLRQSFAGCG
jgi:2-iminoacetate synthase ThiH